MDKRYDNLNNFNSVLSSEFSDAFVNEMKHRVEISYHKYGPARKNFAEGRVDAIKTAEMCLDAFKKDKNTEHLIDAANYLMFRWRFRHSNQLRKGVRPWLNSLNFTIKCVL